MSGMSPQDESSDLSGLAGLYALDALEGDARLRFEAQLGTSPELRAEVSDYRATAARLANISAINPPSDLRARVLSEVGDTRQDSPVVRLDSQPTRSSTRRTAQMLAAAAVVLLAGLGGYLLNDANPTAPSNLASVLAQPDARVIDLISSANANTAGRVVVASSTNQVVIVTDQLQQVADGRTYELWRLDANGPSKAGLFEPGLDGTVEFATEIGLDNTTGFAITEEPDGGSAQPTSPILLSAQVE